MARSLTCGSVGFERRGRVVELRSWEKIKYSQEKKETLQLQRLLYLFAPAPFSNLDPTIHLSGRVGFFRTWGKKRLIG